MVTNQGEVIGKYFLNQLTTTKTTVVVVEEEEGEEPVPTELNTINCSAGFIVVSTDKLSVQYTIVNLHDHDIGVVQSNWPAPVKRLTYYFEMLVKNRGAKGEFSIGFTSPGFKMCRHPGWEANSYGYHGHDGHLYHGEEHGDHFGPTFTEGDTIGAGINYVSQEIFFTKNGVIVGKVEKDVKSPLFPTVAVHSQNEELTVNFGKEPFIFDIKAYDAQERLKQQTLIEKSTLPSNITFDIVRSYLLHYGYEDTLNVFDMANNNSLSPIPVSKENGFFEQDSMYALNHRKTLRQLIRSGDMDAVFDKLSKWYPQIILDDKSPVSFLLHCQKFIELVRVKKLEDAVKYGRAELAKYFGLQEYEELVRECVALLAYEEPSKSPLKHLLGESRREVVSDAVNSLILSTNPNMKDSRSCLHSQLDQLLSQLTACSLESRFLNGNQGEAFCLQQLLHSGKS